MRARHRVAQWTVFGTLYGTKGTVLAARREVAKIFSPLASRLTGSGLRFIAPETVAVLDRWVQRLPFIRQGFGRVLSTLNSSMTIVKGRPNQTALPLAYWKSGRQLDLSAQLDPARDGCGLIWYAPLVEMKPGSLPRIVPVYSVGMNSESAGSQLFAPLMSGRPCAQTVSTVRRMGLIGPPPIL